MSRSLKVLVLGATGQQGGAVTRLLLEKGHIARALTRNTDSSSALKLKELGADLFAGDFNDPASLERAMEGMDSVFTMSTFFEAGIEAEVAQGTAVAAAVKKAGVGHLVYSSVANADRKTGVPHFDSKFRVEEYIKDLAVPYTIVAPVYFFDNVISSFMLPGLKKGSLAMALPGDLKIQQIPVRDIAAFAVLAIDRRDEFFGKRVDIASDELTGLDTAAILSSVLGRKIEYSELPLEQVYAASEDLGRMMDWLARVGYNADITGLRGDYPDIGWHSFGEWARDQDWSVLD